MSTAPEIEITKEMVEAGEDALSRFSRAFDSPDEGVIRIFRAMMAASIAKKEAVVLFPSAPPERSPE